MQSAIRNPGFSALISCVTLLYAPLLAIAEEGVREFGSSSGKRLAGFGRHAKLLAFATEQDRQSAKAIFAKYDLDRSNVLEPSEITRIGWDANSRKQYDRNGDQRIPLQEMVIHWVEHRLEQERANRNKNRSANPAAKPVVPTFSPPESPAVVMRRNMCSTLASQIIGQRDGNNNKILEGAELQKSGSRFGDLRGADVTGDKRVHHVELTTWLTRRLPSLASARLAKPMRLLDINGDGQVAMSEYADRWTEAKLAEFRSFDRDDDGMISPDESYALPISKQALRLANTSAVLVERFAQVSSTIFVNERITIGEISVQVAITKPNDHLLQLTLVGPNGEKVRLFESGWQPWIGALFENTLISDTAPLIENTLPKPPFPRHFRTEALKHDKPGLEQFASKSSRGPWRLIVKNTNQVPAVIHSWSLLITPQK